MIKVKKIKENFDGSADAEISFNKNGLKTLVQWGLIKIIEEGSNTYDPVPIKKKAKKK